MRSLALSVVAGLSLWASEAVAGEPWFVRKECIEAIGLTYAARLTEARQKTAELLAQKDLDARACGVWLSAGLTEMEIALSDDEEKLLGRLDKELQVMDAFGREHGHVAQRFEDFVLEATLRRVHLEVRRGERTNAIRMVEQAQRLLEQRRRVRVKTPTYFYAEAVANLALTHADWTTRTVLRLVGVKGDEERGKKAMKLLLENESVYKPEATCVVRSFALDATESLGDPLDYSRRMYRSYPANPQFALNVANDLKDKNRCKEVPAALAAVQTELSRHPAAYSKKLRQKIDDVLEGCR